jgi:tetratricopeptide (TPR) repeat protein
MRRFAVRFAVVCLMLSLSLSLPAASSWRQTENAVPLGAFSRAEDSPETLADNQIFYNSPHGLEPQASEPAGTISVEQLQHPVSRKGDGLLRRALSFSAKGEHGKAIAQLQMALKERSAMPYAHSLLGSEYLKINQVPAAIDSLEQAVKLLPRNAVDHSNLGYAFFLLGDIERAEREVRQALDLDRNNAKTRFVLGLITHAGGR